MWIILSRGTTNNWCEAPIKRLWKHPRKTTHQPKVANEIHWIFMFTHFRSPRDHDLFMARDLSFGSLKASKLLRTLFLRIIYQCAVTKKIIWRNLMLRDLLKQRQKQRLRSRRAHDCSDITCRALMIIMLTHKIELLMKKILTNQASRNFIKTDPL